MRIPVGRERLILELLAGGRERFGREMMEEETRLKRGTIYTTLDRMENKGYVKSREDWANETRGTPRRMYKITGLGVRALEAAKAAEAVLLEGIAEPS